jgi:hypothetical protein
LELTIHFKAWLSQVNVLVALKDNIVRLLVLQHRLDLVLLVTIVYHQVQSQTP